MSGKRAAILTDSGWGRKIIQEVKNLHSAPGRGGGGLIKISPGATATDGADTQDLAYQPCFSLVGGPTAWL